MMKKVLLFILCSCALIGSVNAQSFNKSDALKLVNQHRQALGLEEKDEVIISDAYFNQMSGIQLVYLQQAYKQLPVYNKLTTIAFRNGHLVSRTGENIASLDKRILNKNTSASLGAADAAGVALLMKGFPSQPLPSPQLTNGKLDFGKLDVSREKTTAELMWVEIPGKFEVVLAWQINLSPVGSSDNWLIRVNANNGSFIDETNLTVYCNFDQPGGTSVDRSTCSTVPETEPSQGLSPFVVNSATYRVVPYPAESPIHPGGIPDVRTNPWAVINGNATSLKWHSDGTNDYNYTRGNNVWAYHDRSNNNSGSVARSASSTTTTDPLSFDFLPDFTQSPILTTPAPNQQFNITNLFYWNNIIHDLAYQYGFDEPSGNFQANNQGRGGQASDYVRAEAQDGSGTNNANFNSPADGGNGVMQMYLWGGNPQKDGDVDNGIVIHEFAHGISTRLTGGPSQAGCLSNNEQMGEGWSDYFALMATQNWSTSLITDGFASPRGIGTYASNQAITGAGIRPRRYTTNMAVNEMTYANLPAQAVPHGVGFVWCTMLWDMTWEIIQTNGINPNIFDPTGTGGNTIALKLITEGMKLQPCSPGFMDGRDAILMADQLLYGGQYRCAIMRAFARRGLGFDASQGSSNNKNDGMAGFSTVESKLTISQSITAQQENLLVTYTNKVTAGACAGITNYILSDTLPSNVTYVSGGTYNAANRVVTFPVNVAANQTQLFSFTVRINTGSWFPTVNLFEDPVAGNFIPGTWTASSSLGGWTASSARSHTGISAYYSAHPAVLSDQRLAMTNSLPLGSTPPPLTFWHWFSTESNYDGGVLESSIDGGNTWTDMGPYLTAGNYSGTMATNSNSPIGGRPAWTGNSNGFIKSEINLSSFANQQLKVRFRSTTDDGTNSEGWYVDDIAFKRIPTVEMRSNLFTPTGVRVNTTDTFTIILETVICSPAAVALAPANTTACAGSNATFNVTASGTLLNQQWQVSTDGGASYTDIPGATTSPLVLTSVTPSMNSNRYRVVLNNSCPSSLTSNPAILTVSNSANIIASPADATVCAGGGTSFFASVQGSSLTYQWQVSVDGGANYTNIPAATGATLTLANVTSAMHNNQYRLRAQSCGPDISTSGTAFLRVNNQASITTSPANATVCPGTAASFTATATGTNLAYQWQLSTDGGNSFSNIPQATGSVFSLAAVSPGMNGYRYRVVLNGECTSNMNSGTATLTVHTPVSITSAPLSTAACAGSAAVFSVTATGTALNYQWQESVSGGNFLNLANGGVYTGVTSPVLTLSGVTGNMNGNSYRTVVTGVPCGSVISTPAALAVNPLPAVTISAANYTSLNPSINTTLTAIASPQGTYSYQWSRNNSSLPGAVNSTLPVYIDGTGNYFVSVTNSNGCSMQSNLLDITELPGNNIFIYPNPNSGLFQVRFYQPASGAGANRTIVIYDSKGSKVFVHSYPSVAGYGRMDVNLSNLQAGIYLVELRDNRGTRLATGKVFLK